MDTSTALYCGCVGIRRPIIGTRIAPWLLRHEKTVAGAKPGNSR